MENGIGLGCILIVLGALTSYYSGMLLVHCSGYTRRHRYEDIALKLYGDRCRTITSILNLLCLMGFIMSFIVYIKSMMPLILLKFYTEEELPSYLGNNFTGKAFWGTIYSFIVLFPLSLPRQISALRYCSLLGVLCSIYLCLAVTIVYWSDKEIVPNPGANLRDAKYFKVSFSGVTSTVPLIIFAYMYQVNIPMIYYELENRSERRMSRVLVIGSSGAVVLYMLIGIFGYATFVNYPGYTAEEALKSGNILEAPYENVPSITAGNFALFFAIAAVSAIVVLPAKDTVEEIFFRGTSMTSNQNILVTFLLILICYSMGLFIPNISAAMTLVGATTNPAVGFILPIVYYWKTI
mmetsp:Transcript_105271/g.145620  ORF Transcript_105271/g.145620 Transcript_105271/m.145620 type:complete len:351 (-) Transcript_105271:123-1175(-)|eukprot:CAMPEP_0176390492 /NCGR_PEP_ID=MMETSP0126-20121128/39215_1 /TAXON_ID=141414 ORGANISM="Strombidinopsis acuminatum, Strain SPMC142" /NCGR_SAMPLE_ID=MMETSP0126 /ASSEMBLY_ACC=CAM_ASM_000229 /LENGTH=350 /DNA_ID=CAMNT_0017759929 /DNA_START=394 /DNA_END=1446 /DNA_ORIENTATION=-